MIRKMIQNRIFDRQMNDVDEYFIEYLIDRWVMQKIFDEIFSASLIYLSNIRSWIICLPIRYSILNHLPVCQIFNPASPACLPDIRFWITCLPARYSILNHRSACQIFDPESPPESPACLSDIRSWMTCLPARYSILHHLPACQIFGPESPTCLPDIWFWITCLHRGYSAFFAWKCTENSVFFCPESAMLFRTHFAIFDNYLKLSKRINERKSLKRKLIKKN